jgi:(p)ppGpp synthase/HD superfamily hydrolase
MTELTGNRLVERAIELALSCHRGQGYGSGPYVLHPLRVLAQVQEWYPADPEVQAAAVLHDAVEDSDLTLYGHHSLAAHGFPRRTIEVVDLVTERTPEVARRLDAPFEDRAGYVLRCAEDPASCAIKLADGADHLAHLHECEPELAARRARKWGFERQTWWLGADGHVRPFA